MRPAFSSTKSAAAFTLLLLLLLLSPVLAGKKLLPPREEAYSNLGWLNGPYPWIYNQIFLETNDVDIAFIGSSRMSRDIDTPSVQTALSEKLGRPAVVRTIAWSWPGYDCLFLIARDLLQHRRVRMLVFYDENNLGKNHRNPALTSFFRFGEDSPLLETLNFRDKEIFYFASLMGLPRTLLSRLRPNMPADLFFSPNGNETSLRTTLSNVKFIYNAPSQLGAVGTRLNYSLGDFMPFTAFCPSNTSQVMVASYSAAHPQSNFIFSREMPPCWQVHFCQLFSRLAKKNDCHLVMLHLPALDPELDQPHSNFVHERTFWPAIISTNLVIIGIPSNWLYGEMSDDDIHKLYFDNLHFNLNGMTFFTRQITPAIIQEYERVFGH